MKTDTAKQKPQSQLHSVFTCAAILGVSRERLTRALTDSGLPTAGEITVARAFTALSAKFQKQETLSRRQEAEAETAEITLAEKKRELLPAKGVELRVGDLIIEWRKTIQAQPKWDSGKLLVALSKIKLAEL